MKAESCVGESREAARRVAAETHLRGSTDAEHNARVKGRAFKQITTAARAAAAGRELAWQTGGGDPAARSSSDACVLVRCTICSSACVHVPCPVPGCGLQQRRWPDGEFRGSAIDEAATVIARVFTCGSPAFYPHLATKSSSPLPPPLPPLACELSTEVAGDGRLVAHDLCRRHRRSIVIVLAACRISPV
jgi:hypothetical protein